LIKEYHAALSIPVDGYDALHAELGNVLDVVKKI
jgi:hypothetical protein